MNRIINISLSVLILVFASSCERDLDSENVSRVTTYATLQLTGDLAMTIMLGETFTDPGIVAKIGEEDVTSQVTTSGTVDTNTPGVYTITYTVVNPDNFPATVSRLVGVIDPAALNYDLTGTYNRVMSGAPQANRISVITKGNYPGLFINDNPGGVTEDDPDLKVDLYMFLVSPTVIEAPVQPTDIGAFGTSGGSYDPITGEFSWAIIHPNFGTAPRLFAKQL